MPKHIILINGSYRADGNISQAICYLAHKLNEEGCHCEIISLNEEEIKFCTNCCNCTQTPGTAPGECVLDDGMSTIVEKLELMSLPLRPIWERSLQSINVLWND